MNALKRHRKANPPPAETCIGEKTVACDCDPGLHCAVLLDPDAAPVKTMACLACGTVTVSVCRGDDGRYTGNPVSAHFALEVPTAVTEWLGQWPRVQIVRSDPRWPMAAELVRREFFYLPAAARCATMEELKKLEEEIVPGQADLSNGQRLLRAVCPTGPPPKELPDGLRGFADVWKTLQSGPETDVGWLTSMAQLRSPARDVAVALLLERPDRSALLHEALRSPDPVLQSAGHALALAMQPPDPELGSILIQLLRQLSVATHPDVPGRVADCRRFEELLVLIADLNLGSEAMFEALTSLQQPLLPVDRFLADTIGIVLNELQEGGAPDEVFTSLP